MKDYFGTDWSGVTGAPYWSKPQLGRRMFFRHLASAVSGYMLLPGRPMETVSKAAVSPKGTAKNCIFFMILIILIIIKLIIFMFLTKNGFLRYKIL